MAISHDLSVDAGRRIAGRLFSAAPGHGYTRDLALEAVLGFAATTGETRWRDQVSTELTARGWGPGQRIAWRSEPFCSLSWAWAATTGDTAMVAGFIAESQAMRRELPRTADGLITHPRGASRGGGDAVLIDSFQEYLSRVCRAGAAAGNPSCFDDCAEQAALHRALLRDPATGLWRQGRGWLVAPVRLSPGCWSRGQGWLMRGFTAALAAIPSGHPAHAAMSALLLEFATDVCRQQQPGGMWHALPHRAPAQSGPEASGTGLIAAGLLRAVEAGFLPRQPFAAHAERALGALLPLVDADGLVHAACPGPGPLHEEEPWMAQSFAPGDHHGPGCVLEAIVAGLRASPA